MSVPTKLLQVDLDSTKYCIIIIIQGASTPRFVRAIVRDSDGKQKIVNIPMDKVKTVSPAVSTVTRPVMPEKESDFFVGNDTEETKESSVKIEVVEEENGVQIEEIETEAEPEVNLLEGECEEIKNEPDTNDYDNVKISDGIDHSALEGMINLCEKLPTSRSPVASGRGLPVEENESDSDEQAIKWTDEQVQEEIEKVGKMGDGEIPKCAICKRSFTSIAYLKSHMRAHKEPLRYCYNQLVTKLTIIQM